MINLNEFLYKQHVSPKTQIQQYQIYFDKRYKDYYCRIESLDEFDAITKNMPKNNIRGIRNRLIDEDIFKNYIAFITPEPAQRVGWNMCKKNEIDIKYDITKYIIQPENFNYKYWVTTFFKK